MQDADRIAGKTKVPPPELLVAVRPDVLNDAEHAVGNFLQRIHHMARVLTNTVESEHAERLRLALSDLERLLELLFDYVLPADVVVRSTEAATVTESLAAQVRAQSGGAVEQNDCPAMRLLVDPKALSRSFQLLGVACGKHWQAAPGVVIESVVERDGERLRIALRCDTGGDPVATAEASLAVAVAAQLVELQGGELEWSESAPAAFSLHLPVQGGGDEAV